MPGFNYLSDTLNDDGSITTHQYNKKTKTIWKTFTTLNNKLHGELTEYYLDGTLKVKETYENGKKIFTNKSITCPYRCGKTLFVKNKCDDVNLVECIICKEDVKTCELAHFLNCNHKIVCLECVKKL